MSNIFRKFDILPKRYDPHTDSVIMEYVCPPNFEAQITYTPNSDGTWTRTEDHFSYSGAVIENEKKIVSNLSVSWSVKRALHKGRKSATLNTFEE